MITQQQIADALGVSRMTVSKALRNHPEISDETRRKVIAEAEKLGYRINPFASTLSRQRGKKEGAFRASVAVLIGHRDEDPLVGNPSYHEYIKGVRKRAEEFGFAVDVFRVYKAGMTPQKLESVLETRGVQAVILLALEQDDYPFPWHKYSCASISATMGSSLFHNASINHFQSTLYALHHLRERGFRRIGFVAASGYDAQASGGLRGAAFVFRSEIPEEERVAPLFYDSLKTGLLYKWFHREQPDVVVTWYTQLADNLVGCGVRVPQDVVVADLDLYPDKRTGIGLKQPWEGIGAAAVDLVYSQICTGETGIPGVPRGITLPPCWVDDGST